MQSFSVEIVSTEEIDDAKADATSRLLPGPGDYERWERLHESLKAVLVEHGTVSWDPEPLPDFYFSGDWFHENTDGFGVSTAAPISTELLMALRAVLAEHHEDAILELNGIADPIDGLVILVTPTMALVAWQDLTPRACEKRLRELGVMLD